MTLELNRGDPRRAAPVSLILRGTRACRRLHPGHDGVPMRVPFPLFVSSVLLLTTGFAFWWKRSGKVVASRLVTGFAGLYTVLLVVAWLAMSGKWG